MAKVTESAEVKVTRPPSGTSSVSHTTVEEKEQKHNSTKPANVTCDLGYTLRGASVLTCRIDASWDYTVPTCCMY